MHEKKGKILGTVLFLLLVLCILFLTFFPAKKNSKGELTMVEITGNRLLEEKDYLSFTRLNDLASVHHVTLPVIKDRIEKHPYIANADVRSEGETARIELSEKNIEAVILIKGEPYFISDNFQVLPMMENTKYELPVISNVKDISDVKPLEIIKNKDVRDAFRILEAAKSVNKNIYRRISEIEFDDIKGASIRLSGINTPFYFGRGEEAKKMVYLEIMWEGIIDGNELIQKSEYIDLRFANEVYVGKNESI